MRISTKLKNALMTIAEECEKHSQSCQKCPMWLGGNCIVTAGHPAVYLPQIAYYVKSKEDTK